MYAAKFCEIPSNPKTLCDWVKNFRHKKINMKRKLRGRNDLRVVAILTTALNSAEKELRRKQQERFQRWMAIQSKFENSNLITDKGNNINNNNYYFRNNSEDTIKKQEEISNLWKYELSSLDEFMKNIGKVKN